MHFIFGLIGVAVGFLITWKSEWFLEQLGHIEWAEEHMGTMGGTRMFWKLLGMAIIFLSFLFMTGALQGIILSVFTPLFRGLGPVDNVK